jgi:hypothetical protein
MVDFDIEFFALDGVPVDGTSGTRAGHVGRGSICIDRNTGILYSNVGSMDSPVWVKTASAAFPSASPSVSPSASASSTYSPSSSGSPSASKSPSASASPS